MIETALRSILVNDDTVAALTTRCYPVMLPQNPTYPLILYTKISGERAHHLSGVSGHAHPRFQVEAWAETYTAAKTLAEAIREALDGYMGTDSGVEIGSCLIDSEHDIYEPELKVYRVLQDYMIWHEE
jgi:hypothetical protein